MSISNGQFLEFDSIEPRCIPVRIGKNWYVLSQASGDATVKFRNANAKATKLADGKVVGVGNIADSEYELVKDCLFESDPGDTPPKSVRLKIVNGYPCTAFTLAQVRSWPNHISGKLYDTIKEISPGLVEETRNILEKRLLETKKKLSELDEAKADNARANGDERGGSSEESSSPEDSHTEEMAKN